MSAQTNSVLLPDPGDANLKPGERLLLWRLAGAGGGEWISGIRPVPKPSMRRDLADRNLVRLETRKNPSTGRPGTWMELTETGWRWTRENMGGEFGSSTAAGDTLSVMLRALNHFMEVQNLTAEDVFRAAAAGESHHPGKSTAGPQSNILPFRPPAGEEPLFHHRDEEDDEVEEEGMPIVSPMVDAAITRAYYRISGGVSGVKVRLYHLRQCVEMMNEELDAALFRMDAEEKLQLLALDPEEGEPSGEDEEAEFVDSRGRAYHVVRITGVPG